MLTSCSLLLDFGEANPTQDGPLPPEEPQTGLSIQGFCSSSSVGNMTQTDNQGNTNYAVIGDSTPPLIGAGGIQQKSEEHQNLAGFISAQY